MEEMTAKYLSAQNVERLPRYYMILCNLRDYGIKTVTSKELAHYEGIDESLVRKDLSAVKVEGRKRVGYDVYKTIEALREILGISVEHRAVLVGVGNLGKALTNFNGFERYNVKIIGLFDSDNKKCKTKIGKLVIMPMEDIKDFVQKHNADDGIIAVPAGVGQEVADELVFAGVKSIWNFAPVPVKVPDGIYLRNENLAASLVTLTFWLTQSEKHKKGDPNARRFSTKSGRSKAVKNKPSKDDKNKKKLRDS